MDKTRRNFILGISSACAAITISSVTGTPLALNKSNTTDIQNKTYIPKWEFSSYDIFSPAIIGSAVSAFALNNIDCIYSIIIILITIFLLVAIGIPGYAYLLNDPALFYEW